MFDLVLAVLLAAGPPAPAGDRLLVCGGEEVFVLAPGDPPAADPIRLWRWRAADSPEIPRAMHAQFRTTDECKPAGGAVLITASSGGVALVRRRDRKCLFYTSVKNAHSACLTPGGRVAVASSHGGDEVLLFAPDRSGADVAPLARQRLDGAHGVHWDAPRDRLWALGTKELLLIRLRGGAGAVEMAVDKRWELPSPGGHDLSPARDPDGLFVTTGTHVYRFDARHGRFEALPALGETPRVKSIDQNPRTGRVVYHQAGEKNWWSDTIRFLEPARALRLPDERLYKVRWDAERDGAE